jgi:type III pantothenate kinase
VLLAIDARNRSIAVGLREGGVWRAVRRLGSPPERSADEYAMLIPAALGLDSQRFDAAGIESVWVSSVVPALTPKLVEAIRTAFGLEASVIGPGTRTGVRIRTEVPTEVGSALVCAAAAARRLSGGACVVVDFGVALSFSAVDSSGDFLGAAIAPGPEAAAEALRVSAAQIPEVRLDSPPCAIGRNTAQSVQSGIVLGYGGLVSRLTRLMAAEMGAEGASIIGTGSEIGRAILASCEPGARFVPELVLEGIALVAERSRATAR